MYPVTRLRLSLSQLSSETGSTQGMRRGTRVLQSHSAQHKGNHRKAVIRQKGNRVALLSLLEKGKSLVLNILLALTLSWSRLHKPMAMCGSNRADDSSLNYFLILFIYSK